MKMPQSMLSSIALVMACTFSLAAPTWAGVKLLLANSPEIPAAQGVLKLKGTRNGNTQLNLSVRHLALPGRIVPGANVFVIWARGLAYGTDAQNLGVLKVKNDLSARFQSVTAMQSFDFFLTCEESPTALTPSGPQLLSAQYVKR